MLSGPAEPFAVGGSKVLRQSDTDRAAVVAAGVTLHEALKAWGQLKDRGVPIRVIDCYSIKPVDRAGLLAAARATGGWLIVVEDHYPEGGLGDAVLDALATEGIRVHKLAVRELPRSGKPQELLDRFGISAQHIAAKVLKVVGEN